MKILALFLAILGLASALEVSDLALKTDNIGGKFSETLSIEGFAEPVRSSGEFRIKGGELFWTTLEPVRSELKIGADGVLSVAARRGSKAPIRFLIRIPFWRSRAWT